MPFRSPAFRNRRRIQAIRSARVGSVSTPSVTSATVDRGTLILRGQFLTNTSPPLEAGDYLAMDITMKDKGLAGCPLIITSITDDAIRLRQPRFGEIGAGCVYHNHYEYDIPVFMKDYWKVQSVLGPYALVGINILVHHMNSWISAG